MSIQPPYLSQYDPPESGEGSIDPLGLQATYEHLAERVLPFITVRMARPRFLTAMVVGACVCEDFNGQMAKDDRTPPWLVFEWYIIEGLIRTRTSEDQEGMRRIPGSLKVEQSIRNSRHISAANYLKTPQVFGYNGVYRRLARGLHILQDNLELDEGGIELLQLWEQEQRLEGFFSGSHGKGAEFRELLRKAVGDGLKAGATQRNGNWEGWARIRQYFYPAEAGKKEAAAIFRRLVQPGMTAADSDTEAACMRSEFIERLVEHKKVVKREEETVWFRILIKSASADLRVRINTIDAYEGVCRILDDAIRLILHLSTIQSAATVTAKDFSDNALGSTLASRLPDAVARLRTISDAPERETVIQDLIHRYTGVTTPWQLFDTVLDHHQETMRQKPPDGKRPWVEQVRNGFMVRPLYAQPHPPAGADRYVYDYRTASVSSFLVDLKRISP